MDISVRTVGTWQTEDRSWLGSAHGTEATASVTLDASAFTANTHYPNGFIPSGVIIAKNTSTGYWVPYVNGGANGTGTPVGLLFSSVRVASSTAKIGAALFQHGFVVEAKLPSGSGVDSAAKTALAGRVTFR